MLSASSPTLYLLLVAAVGVERLLELALTARNVRRAFGRGGVEVGRRHYPWMVAIHTAFLLSCPLEVWLLDRPLLPPLALAMGLLLIVAVTLRYWVVLSLGDRWTTRVIYVSGDPLVLSGPFRYLRHPNYAAVVLEIVALPMIHTAWITALVFSVANAVILTVRIRVENDALARLSAPGPS